MNATPPLSRGVGGDAAEILFRARLGALVARRLRQLEELLDDRKSPSAAAVYASASIHSRRTYFGFSRLSRAASFLPFASSASRAISRHSPSHSIHRDPVSSLGVS